MSTAKFKAAAKTTKPATSSVKFDKLPEPKTAPTNGKQKAPKAAKPKADKKEQAQRTRSDEIVVRNAGILGAATQGMEPDAIAKHYGISVRIVKSVLRKAGIKPPKAEKKSRAPKAEKKQRQPRVKSTTEQRAQHEQDVAVNEDINALLEKIRALILNTIKHHAAQNAKTLREKIATVIS